MAITKLNSMKAFVSTLSLSLLEYFEILANACSLRLAVLQLLDTCSAKSNLQSIFTPKCFTHFRDAIPSSPTFIEVFPSLSVTNILHLSLFTIHQKALSCASCSLMIHIKCKSITLEGYIQIQEANDSLTDEEIQAKKWKCSKCVILNLAKNFPFVQQSNYELINIINNDTMKALEHLPSYDIVSQASDFESLIQADIDENIITNINSRYYPVHEFNKLNRENSFNIFHTNINGLEIKFDLLHNLINSTELDVDLITISETSQKENTQLQYQYCLGGIQASILHWIENLQGRGCYLYKK